MASAAEYLALPGLKAGCEEAVVSALTVENAVETLMEAERRELQVSVIRGRVCILCFLVRERC